MTNFRDALLQSLNDLLCYSVKRDRPGAAEKVLEAMEKHFAKEQPYTWDQAQLDIMKLMVKNLERMVARPIPKTLSYKEIPDSSTCPLKEDEHVLYWKRRAKEYKPDGVNIGPSAWIEIARESGYNPKVCAALRSIELCCDSYLDCLKVADPDVAELLALIEEHFHYSPTPLRFEYSGQLGKLADTFRRVKAKYE